jgi:hypothetical protein
MRLTCGDAFTSILVGAAVVLFLLWPAGIATRLTGDEPFLPVLRRARGAVAHRDRKARIRVVGRPA